MTSAHHQKINGYIRLMRLNKPIGIFLLLWPTLMALWLAGKGKPDLWIVIIFVLGTIVMRSAGCVINDIADRQFDKEVVRTQNRPMVLGIISTQEALYLFCFLIFLALLLVIQLNFLTILMSFVALSLAMIYPLMKRYTHLPQIVLGAAFGWAIPMAYTALTNQLTSETFLLYVAMLCWTVSYDTQYAMADRLDDLRIGVKSTAILFGRYDRVMVFSLQLITLGLLSLLGNAIQAGICYHLGVVIAFGFTCYQQYLIKDRDPDCCIRAFLNNNYFGASLFVGLLFDYGFSSFR